MSDALLTSNDQKEALSRAYVAIVAAGAGYTLAVRDFDRDGVDVLVRAGGGMRPSLDIQLKATARLGQGEQEEEFRYKLPRRNYDLLRGETQTPRILVVLDLPEDEEQWVDISAERLVMRRCAYWASLEGCPETDNTTRVTITLKKRNRFDIKSLKKLMEWSRTRTGVMP